MWIEWLLSLPHVNANESVLIPTSSTDFINAADAPTNVWIPAFISPAGPT